MVNTCSLACEVTRGGVSHLNACFVCVERSVGTFQLRTVIKYIFIINFVTNLPVTVAENSGQGSAVIEHDAYVDDVFGIDFAQVERCQCRTVREHGVHVGDVLGIEVA